MLARQLGKDIARSTAAAKAEIAAVNQQSAEVGGGS
jgi:hypothetical protein